MKIRILKDHDHRLSTAAVLAFKAGTVDDRPRAMAEKLIALGVAEAIPTKTDDKKEG